MALASTHLIPEYIRDLEIAPLDLWFDSGSDVLPGDFPLGRSPAWLVTDLGWSARLIGFGAFEEVSTGAKPGEVRPTIELARRRTENVRQALIERTCRREDGRNVGDDCELQTRRRIRIVNQGGYGLAPYENRRLVRMEVYRGTLIDTITHEAGHMLGLGDEASTDTWAAGTTLHSPDYAALVLWYLNELVLRHDDDGIMSRGTVVRPRHYVAFLEALEELTGLPGWRIVDP